jgi:hypothetical protein
MLDLNAATVLLIACENLRCEMVHHNIYVLIMLCYVLIFLCMIS